MNCVSISVCLRIEFFQKSWYDINKLFNCNHKKFVKKAFEKHMKGEGFCLVELLSPCPTNLNTTPAKSVERIKNEMIKYFPLGEFKDKKEEE